MQPDLIAAHEALDIVVDRAFGAIRRLHTDEERLSALFTDYRTMNSDEAQGPSSTRKEP